MRFDRYDLALGVTQRCELATEDTAGINVDRVVEKERLGYRLPAPWAWVAKSLGYGEVETATRFPLLHTPDCDYRSTKIAALH
jgi:hypothetical protein